MKKQNKKEMVRERIRSGQNSRVAGSGLLVAGKRKAAVGCELQAISHKLQAKKSLLIVMVFFLVTSGLLVSGLFTGKFSQEYNWTVDGLFGDVLNQGEAFVALEINDTSERHLVLDKYLKIGSYLNKGAWNTI